MPYYILRRYNGTHHYVCVYALLDYYPHCMPHYTHHKHKGAHDYAIVDVLSDSSGA